MGSASWGTEPLCFPVQLEHEHGRIQVLEGDAGERQGAGFMAASLAIGLRTSFRLSWKLPITAVLGSPANEALACLVLAAAFNDQFYIAHMPAEPGNECIPVARFKLNQIVCELVAYEFEN